MQADRVKLRERVLVTRWLTIATAVLCPRGVVLRCVVLCCVVKGLAKPINARVQEAIKHLVTAKQFRLPI